MKRLNDLEITLIVNLLEAHKEKEKRIYLEKGKEEMVELLIEAITSTQEKIKNINN